jgi:hypothetical protein
VVVPVVEETIQVTLAVPELLGKDTQVVQEPVGHQITPETVVAVPGQ